MCDAVCSEPLRQMTAYDVADRLVTSASGQAVKLTGAQQVLRAVICYLVTDNGQ